MPYRFKRPDAVILSQEAKVCHETGEKWVRRAVPRGFRQKRCANSDPRKLERPSKPPYPGTRDVNRSATSSYAVVGLSLLHQTFLQSLFWSMKTFKEMSRCLKTRLTVAHRRFEARSTYKTGGSRRVQLRPSSSVSTLLLFVFIRVHSSCL